MSARACALPPSTPALGSALPRRPASSHRRTPQPRRHGTPQRFSGLAPPSQPPPERSRAPGGMRPRRFDRRPRPGPDASQPGHGPGGHGTTRGTTHSRARSTRARRSPGRWPVARAPVPAGRGPRAWVQHPRYDIDARLDPDAGRVSGQREGACTATRRRTRSGGWPCTCGRTSSRRGARGVRRCPSPAA